MRLLNSLCVAFAALSPFALAQTDYFVVLPGHINKSTQETLSKGLVDLVVGAEAGDRFTFLDGEEIVRVTAFERPEARSARSVSRRLRREFAELGTYLKRELDEDSAPLDANRLLHPQALAMIAELRNPERPTRCVLLGSPFYRNPKEPSFAMGGGLYPSDAHLDAAAAASVYSVKAKKRALEGCLVYHSYLEEGFKDSFERDATRRWWSLFVSAQSGVLAHLSASTPDAIESALRGSKRAAIAAEIDERDTRVEMRRAGAAVPVQPRSKLSRAADALPAPAKGKFTVAAFWPVADGSRVDVDIHLLARPGAQEISFRRKKTPDGKLLRDITGGGGAEELAGWRASWEVVEVNETLLRDAKAWLNLYSYQGPGPIEGIVRVARGNLAVDLPFKFEHGVSGGRSKLKQGERARSSQWVEIDLAAAFERLGNGG